MLIFIALLYFCLVCSVVWCVLFPAWRDFVVGLGQRLPRARAIALPRTGKVRRAAARLAWRALKFVRRHALAFGAGAAAVAIPSVIALTMSNPSMLPGYEVADLPPD